VALPIFEKSDARFEALAESAPDAIVTIDEQSVILSANPAIERIFGYERNEIVGQRLSILIPERLRASHELGVARYLRTGRRNIPWTGVELPALRKDGREIPVEISFGEFVDDTGRRVFSGFIRDVSERVRQQRELETARATAERALRELQRISRVTDEAMGRATYDELLRELLERLRTELAANGAAVSSVEPVTCAAELLAGDGSATLDESTVKRIIESCQPVLTDDVAAVPVYSGSEVIGILHAVSGEERFGPSDIRLLEVVAGRMAGVFARTRAYHAERTLRSLAQSITGAMRIDEVMHQIAEGARMVSGATGTYVEQVISTDGDVEVVAGSGQQTPTVGQRVPYPGSLTEEIIEQREPIFLNRMQGMGAAMAPYLADCCPECSVLVVPLVTSSSVLGALVLLRRPGEPAFEKDVVARVRTLANLASIALQRLVALAESERRRSEAEAAVRSRDEMLSIVSHDLRNPVSTVAMSAALLADRELALTPDQQRAQFGVIARSAQRMNRLIQDLLDVARIEGGRLTISCRCEEARALAIEAYEAFRPISEEKSIELRCEAAKVLPRVYVDRDRILQLLSNYLNNALKFTPEGGCITLRAIATGDGTRFDVVDTGPGIAPEDQPQLFRRFWQAKPTAHLGSGLGLAISKGIAEAHRGRVTVESEVGKGSTFSLWLPLPKDCSQQ
jgi:PAS domain S-box-containing protein